MTQPKKKKKEDLQGALQNQLALLSRHIDALEERPVPPKVTLRDVFAAQALGGICTLEDGHEGAEKAARVAYALADAMVAVRGSGS